METQAEMTIESSIIREEWEHRLREVESHCYSTLPTSECSCFLECCSSWRTWSLLESLFRSRYFSGGTAFKCICDGNWVKITKDRIIDLCSHFNCKKQFAEWLI